MIDRILSRAGVGFALFLVIMELTYINAKSLYFMAQGMMLVDSVFAVIGSLAFSMVTILVMRMSKRRWLKVAFPLFDAALVLCGFNLMFADGLFANPIRFALSVFLAIFTGLITYSLGQINAEQHDGSKVDDSKRIIDDLNRIIDDLTTKQNESNLIIDELKMNQTESKRIADDSKKIAAETKRIANEILPNHILFTNWNNSKKKVENRNGLESMFGTMAERIKSGETITIDEYSKKLNAITYGGIKD